MDDFMKKLEKTAFEKYNLSVTEKGAVGYRTTGSKLTDIHFAVSSLRNAPEKTVIASFAELYAENKLLAVKWLFLVADVRGGLGERRLFRVCLSYLASADRQVAVKLLPLVAEYTRWDNLVYMLDTDVAEEAAAILKAQLDSDLTAMREGKSVSLLGKWLPSVNASDKNNVRLARLLCKKWGLTAAQYRKTLSALRARLELTEVLMSAGKWKLIKYSAVPSRANLIYRKAFITHDEQRRGQYLVRVAQRKAKINAEVLFPHDIVYKYHQMLDSTWDPKTVKPDETVELLWKALPDYVDGASSTLCIADGSGSMYSHCLRSSNVAPIDIAAALTVYFSERSKGRFADKFITFSETPQIVSISRYKTLFDKVNCFWEHNEIANTNIEAVFELILETAVKYNVPQSELPQNLLILSDMEFDMCACDKKGKILYDDTTRKALFDTISERYAEHGYTLPRLVFWNICSRTKTIPIIHNSAGLALVSGFSPSVAKMVLSQNLDPLGVIVDQLENERYAPVEQAVLAALGK